MEMRAECSEGEEKASSEGTRAGMIFFSNGGSSLLLKLHFLGVIIDHNR